MKRSTWIVVVLSSLTCDAGNAQTNETPESSEQQQLVAQLRALDWVKGPTTVQVGDNSRLIVPGQYVFLDRMNTTKFLELQHNLGGGHEVMVAPRNMRWSAYLVFSDEGYVKDDEKIDSAALLSTLKQNTENANEERKRRGWAPLHVVDWATPPAYNTKTKRLEWATVLDSENGRAVNFSTKILGRRGHTSLVMVTDPANLQTAEQDLDGVLDGYSFNPGETYGDWRKGDKVAEYGLAALIVGGAAAVAAKKGLFSVVAGFLIAAWKFVAAAVLGAFAWVRSLFKKRSDAAV
ncbi:MAG: DUF2167 domain-containing protein [Steroidobacteraceae bacterium]